MVLKSLLTIIICVRLALKLNSLAVRLGLSFCMRSCVYTFVVSKSYDMAKNNKYQLHLKGYVGSWDFDSDYVDYVLSNNEAQGELPSQTQLNKLTAVHPSVGEEASAAAAYLNNNDNVFLVENMKGKYRVVGSEAWTTKTTVTQDLG